jgi:tRNA1(Val) A37 N6-methylase TrmN6
MCLKRIELFKNKHSIYIPPDAPGFSVDSVILANSVIPLKNHKIADLGSGTGIIPFFLKILWAHVTGLEIWGYEKELILYESSLHSLNKSSFFKPDIFFINSDIKNHPEKKFINYYDTVVSNPPYFRADQLNAHARNLEKNTLKLKMKNESHTELKDFFIFTSKILKPKGLFKLIMSTQRFSETLCLAGKYGLGIKNIQFIHSDPLKCSHIFLCSMIKGCSFREIKISAPFFIMNQKNEFSDTMKKIYQKFGF